jgi:methylmalonyl-CoA mutase
VRIVSAASLFDGHDAAINIMRRILQRQGAEVIHLGHNRSVADVVQAVVEEDAHAVALSSYQGGHMEYFTYLRDRLGELGYDHVKIYGGGGGVIVADEIAELAGHDVTIFSPEDGQRMGLAAMVNQVIAGGDYDIAAVGGASPDDLATGDARALGRTLTLLEEGVAPDDLMRVIDRGRSRDVPVLGITGTGGAGKSSLTDELINRFRLDQEDKLRIAVLAIDPTRRRGGGALLGDRIRMNSVDGEAVFFRSIATRGESEIPEHLDDAIAACKAAGFDLIIVETPGIGQGDAGIVPHVDYSMYVMTPEFGAASQLEKIDMLDFADVVVINKFERRGADDALRDVRRQVARNHESFDTPLEELPVFGTIASRFNDDGVTSLYHHLKRQLTTKGLAATPGILQDPAGHTSTEFDTFVPTSSARYLEDISKAVRTYHARTGELAATARSRQHLTTAKTALEAAGKQSDDIADLIPELDLATDRLLSEWPEIRDRYSGDTYTYEVRGRSIEVPLTSKSLSGSTIPRVAVPRTEDHGDLVRFLRSENLPGSFPFTGGVFPFKRDAEDPTRMFAGEGDAFQTNERFHILAADHQANRLSTAFDSVTLYGFDPHERPDIYGKVGNSGVSIATLDDMKELYRGFDLLDPATSVSMTINGPAPTILAMFLNTAIEQQLALFRDKEGREPTAAEAADIRARTLSTVRGTVQADILKEDQGQNTLIFSTEFSLRMMADIQEWFIEQQVRNFYSVSISGYHIAEAGANPISQLAFTLSNGFTFVEAYLARGMDIDDFAPNLSFFFSNGMDPEYSVIGRVARRIWAIAMRDRYGANERSQKLKYHIQTSGRSLHAQEMSFNDIRTTLQALIAIYDNANSLHTNAFDEAVTTPTEESVRRAVAIQLIINREWGLAMNENPLQGSFIIDELTDLVEEAVLQEFERISSRGGVLGAMERGYQRGKIQDESMLYEQRKHDGSLPIVGVNTFLADETEEARPVELIRSTEEVKQRQLHRLHEFQARGLSEREAMEARLRDAVLSGDNVFAVLMDAVRVMSLGQITDLFFEVGGKYRRNV